MAWTLLRARSTQVGWSLKMVGGLPRFLDEPSLPDVVRPAVIDAFYSHARCVAEFLVGKRDTRLIQRHDFLPNWDLPDSELPERVGRILGTATTHVSHLSKDRVPVPGAEVIQPISRMDMEATADTLFAAFDEFVEAMREADAELADQMALYLADASAQR